MEIRHLVLTDNQMADFYRGKTRCGIYKKRSVITDRFFSKLIQQQTGAEQSDVRA